MSDDKKTLKFQMMMSPAEAEVLDDWMFKNRVRSRAEAIRRLCQVGLITDERLNKSTTNLAKLFGLISLVDEQWRKLINQHTGKKDTDLYIKRLALLFQKSFPITMDTTFDANNHLFDFISAANAILNAPTATEGMARLQQADDEARARWRQWEQEETEASKRYDAEKRKSFAENSDVDEALKIAEQLIDVGDKQVSP